MSNFELLNQKLSASHLPALNGIRFIAVFLVIFYHAGFESVPSGHGVMLFFVLSGFLITWLLLKENETYGTISLKRFYKRRILRIFPAFYVYSFVAVALLIIGDKIVPWMHAIASFFYVSNYYYALNQNSDNLFSHTWSLSVEEQFYLCFPFLFLAFCSNLKRLTSVIYLIIALTWIWRIVLVFGFDVSGGYIYCAFDTRLDHLLDGCLLAIILREEKLKKFWQIMLKSTLMPFLTIGVLAISIYFSQANVTYKSTVGFTIEPILLAVLITQAITFSSHRFWKWLDFAPIKFLGALSYSLYLWQQLTTSIIHSNFPNSPLIIKVLLIIIVTILVATVSYYFVETPFLQLKTMTVREVYNFNLLKLKRLLNFV
jgi:peptidoglycan/LPS O-acetylase OafA/YrhL